MGLVKRGEIITQFSFRPSKIVKALNRYMAIRCDCYCVDMHFVKLHFLNV